MRGSSQGQKLLNFVVLCGNMKTLGRFRVPFLYFYVFYIFVFPLADAARPGLIYVLEYNSRAKVKWYGVRWSDRG